MPGPFCATCGTQYPDADTPPQRCAICEDPRQFVPDGGQRWIWPDRLAAGHANAFRHLAPGLTSIASTPAFGIGQRAILIRTPAGNVLWDCISLLDPATVAIVAGLGGLAAVAVSHPHFFSAMAAWGETFNCPVLVHAADREWVVRKREAVAFWDGETHAVLPGLTLHRLGGHFSGSCVLHVADGRMLLTGDTVMVGADRASVSFMWSFPNRVPLPAPTVSRIGERLAALDFDAVYAAFDGLQIETDAKAVVARSVDRYIRAISGDRPAT